MKRCHYPKRGAIGIIPNYVQYIASEEMTTQSIFADRGQNHQIERGLSLMPKLDANGLIACIASDHASGEVLMFAYMNQEAFEFTLKTGEAHYWSRSRQELWHKGATSGNVQRVVEIRVDCDQDAVWMRVEPAGPACHVGARSCFYRIVERDAANPARLRIVEDGAPPEA